MVKYVTIDTREFCDTRETSWDGFVHIVPRKAPGCVLHTTSLSCWCEPVVSWPNAGDTLVVRHRARRVRVDEEDE